MNVPTWAKPVALGAAGGAVATMVVGFAFGGWVTAGTASDMQANSAEAAIVQSFTPVCVAKAEQQPEKHAGLKESRSWRRDTYVIEAGWVDNVKEDYKQQVASACAKVVVDGMETS
jgi:hypothetical protein